MQPPSANAATAAKIDNRNARATRTGAIPRTEIGQVLHRVWLIKRFGRRAELVASPMRPFPGATRSIEPQCAIAHRGISRHKFPDSGFASKSAVADLDKVKSNSGKPEFDARAPQ